MTADLSQTLAGLTGATSVIVPVSANASQALGSVGLNAVSGAIDRASLSQALASLTSTSTGASLAVAVLSASLGPATLSSFASQTLRSNLDLALAGLTGASAGAVRVQGNTSVTLGALVKRLLIAVIDFGDQEVTSVGVKVVTVASAEAFSLTATNCGLDVTAPTTARTQDLQPNLYPVLSVIGTINSTVSNEAAVVAILGNRAP